MASQLSESRSTELTRSECDALLVRSPVGRIGFVFADEPLIMPVTYRYDDGEIVFRTAAGMKLHGIAADRRVSFEIDGWDEQRRRGWSVLVIGSAAEITEWDRLRHCDELGLEPWAPVGDDDRWIAIQAERVTGRRVEQAPS